MRIRRRRPKVGLALSGGGARGLAHIGVLKVLEREEIPVDFLAGTSMGGVIAAGYAAGLSTTTMEKEALRMSHITYLMNLFDISFPKMGLVEGKKVQEYFYRHLGDVTFDELRIPLALVAVDLETGEEVILREGRVAEAVRATISMPGVFAPFRLNGRLLVDGGVLNAVPADVVRQMGAEVVIAVDVSAELEETTIFREAEKHRVPLSQIPVIIETLKRTVGIMEREIREARLAQARPEVLIHPPIGNDVTIFGGFGKAAEVITAGEMATLQALPQIRKALKPRLAFDWR